MVKKYLSMLVFLGAMMFGFTACGDDDDDNGNDNGTEVKDASLEVSAKNVYFSNAAGEETIKVKANGSWKVTCDADWLNVSPLKGNDDQTITIEADANKGSEREATIKITLGDLTQKIKVTQVGVKSYTFRETIEKVDMLGSREIKVAKGDTIVYCVKHYWDNSNNGTLMGPVIGYIVITDAASDAISFNYVFRPAWEDYYEVLSSSTRIYDAEMSDAYYQEKGFLSYGCVGVDYQTGLQTQSFLETGLGYEGISYFFEKKKGEPVLTNYPSKKIIPNNDNETEEYNYPEVTFMKVGNQN